ncbi:MAG TPA: MarR family transcriptional regulator [Terriglobales bacterium]|jgi:DNA-binding MarR family transcriptional regulator|nr:MarR family transcriptional regulator [Terriglobales bacterium]
MSPRGILYPNYKLMAEFRYQIRRFLRFSEDTARGGGLEPQQYQLMLTLKSMDPEVPPRIGAVAERLQIQHHSTVELVDRLVRRALIRRRRSDSDRREVMLELTPRGDKVLHELALRHWVEYRDMAPGLISALKKVIRETQTMNGSRPARSKATTRS